MEFILSVVAFVAAAAPSCTVRTATEPYLTFVGLLRPFGGRSAVTMCATERTVLASATKLRSWVLLGVACLRIIADIPSLYSWHS